MAQDQWTLKRKVSREPGCSHAVSGSCNAGVGNVAGCSHAVQDPPPFNMDAVNIMALELRNAVSVPAQVAHAMNITAGWMDANTVHRPPLQARVVAANRAVLANCATILAHMGMNRGRGNAKQNGAK